MPYFKWKGIALDGSIHKGVLRARSSKDLDGTLLKNEIALLSCCQIRQWSLLRPITTSLKVTCFRRLSTLLDSGVYLDEALFLLKEHTSHHGMAQLLDDILEDIRQGTTLHDSLVKYPELFDGVTIQLIHAGHETGKLATTLSVLADHLERVEAFYKKLKGAAAMPAVTFIFFLGITIAIFSAIVPTVASLFQTTGQTMPASAQWMIHCNRFFTLRSLLALLLGSIVCLYVLKRLYAYRTATRIVDAALYRLPIIGGVLQDVSITYFLHTLSLLVNGGVHVAPALETTIATLGNHAFLNQIETIQQKFSAGTSLSEGMKEEKNIFLYDVIALIKVGEESGRLGAMFDKAADIYRARIDRHLFYLTTLFQPLLMIVLGLLVMALVISVYMPIFNLSFAIG